MATSARCMSTSTSWPCSGKEAMPTLAPSSRRTPATSKCSAMARRTAAATATPAAGVSTARRRIANSSPPRRATVSSSPQQAREALAHLAQHLVAVVVAEGVVDLLEAVEVEQHDRDVGPGAPGARDRVLGARAEEDAVGQTGQRVVQGEALGDERLAAGTLDGDHGQGQQRQQHRRRVEREDGERREAQQDALGGRLADELGGDLVAQAGAGRHRDGTGHEAGVDDEEDERGGEDGRDVGGAEVLVVGQDARGDEDCRRRPRWPARTAPR